MTDLVRLAIDRDSVSMGDDERSHAIVLTLPAPVTLAGALAAAHEHRFLADVASFLFVVRPGEHGPALAVIRSHHVRYLVPPDTPLDPPALRFEYHRHDDMTALWTALAEPGRPPIDHIF